MPQQEATTSPSAQHQQQQQHQPTQPPHQYQQQQQRHDYLSDISPHHNPRQSTPFVRASQHQQPRPVLPSASITNPPHPQPSQQTPHQVQSTRSSHHRPSNPSQQRAQPTQQQSAQSQSLRLSQQHQQQPQQLGRFAKQPQQHQYPQRQPHSGTQQQGKQDNQHTNRQSHLPIFLQHLQQSGGLLPPTGGNRRVKYIEGLLGMPILSMLQKMRDMVFADAHQAIMSAARHIYHLIITNNNKNSSMIKKTHRQQQEEMTPQQQVMLKSLWSRFPHFTKFFFSTLAKSFDRFEVLANHLLHFYFIDLDTLHQVYNKNHNSVQHQLMLRSKKKSSTDTTNNANNNTNNNISADNSNNDFMARPFDAQQVEHQFNQNKQNNHNPITSSAMYSVYGSNTISTAPVDSFNPHVVATGQQQSPAALARIDEQQQSSQHLPPQQNEPLTEAEQLAHQVERNNAKIKQLLQLLQGAQEKKELLEAQCQVMEHDLVVLHDCSQHVLQARHQQQLTAQQHTTGQHQATAQEPNTATTTTATTPLTNDTTAEGHAPAAPNPTTNQQTPMGPADLYTGNIVDLQLFHPNNTIDSLASLLSPLQPAHPQGGIVDQQKQVDVDGGGANIKLQQQQQQPLRRGVFIDNTNPYAAENQMVSLATAGSINLLGQTVHNKNNNNNNTTTNNNNNSLNKPRNPLGLTQLPQKQHSTADSPAPAPTNAVTITYPHLSYNIGRLSLAIQQLKQSKAQLAATAQNVGIHLDLALPIINPNSIQQEVTYRDLNNNSNNNNPFNVHPHYHPQSPHGTMQDNDDDEDDALKIKNTLPIYTLNRYTIDQNSPYYFLMVYQTFSTHQSSTLITSDVINGNRGAGVGGDPSSSPSVLHHNHQFNGASNGNLHYLQHSAAMVFNPEIDYEKELKYLDTNFIVNELSTASITPHNNNNGSSNTLTNPPSLQPSTTLPLHTPYNHIVNANINFHNSHTTLHHHHHNKTNLGDPEHPSSKGIAPATHPEQPIAMAQYDTFFNLINHTVKLVANVLHSAGSDANWPVRPQQYGHNDPGYDQHHHNNNANTNNNTQNNNTTNQQHVASGVNENAPRGAPLAMGPLGGATVDGLMSNAYLRGRDDKTGSTDSSMMGAPPQHGFHFVPF